VPDVEQLRYQDQCVTTTPHSHLVDVVDDVVVMQRWCEETWVFCDNWYAWLHVAQR